MNILGCTGRTGCLQSVQNIEGQNVRGKPGFQSWSSYVLGDMLTV